MHATTIVSVRKGASVAIAGDGQVSLGNTVVKNKAKKIRRLHGGAVLAGFAGSTADAITLFEKFEHHLDKAKGNLRRAAVELAKEWRTDRYLRKLEALMIVANVEHSLLISGSGDVVEPDDGVLAIGSGGNFALAAAHALVDHSNLSVIEIAREALKYAANICVFTNQEIVAEELT